MASFNPALDIISKIHQAGLFGLPKTNPYDGMSEKMPPPNDHSPMGNNGPMSGDYIPADIARTNAQIGAMPDRDMPPQSSDDDIIAQIQSMFQPQHEAQDALRELMSQQPTRAENAPSFWRKLAAGAVAGGNPDAAEKWANRKYYQKSEEWKSRLNPIKELADSEQSTNTNQRSITNQLILDESRRRETDRKTAADTAKNQLQRDQLNEKYYYASIRERALYQPNLVQFMDDDGKLYSFDKKSGDVNPVVNPQTGDHISGNKLPEREQLKLKQNQELARIVARGAESRKTVEAQGTKEIKEDKAKQPGRIEVKTTVPGKNTSPVEGSGGGAKKEKTVRVISPDGKTHGTLPESKLAEYIKKGYKVE